MKGHRKATDPSASPIRATGKSKGKRGCHKAKHSAPEWNARFDDLCAYLVDHGDTLVPRSYPPNQSLSDWVRVQRKHYHALVAGRKSTVLTPERLQALMAVGFVFDVRREAWKTRYDELLGFRAAYGHCNVPLHYEGNPQLGVWVNRQRAAYKNYLSGDNPALTRERVEALEAIGFQWSQTQHAWYTMLNRLRLFIKEFGTCTIPAADEANRDLRLWVWKQRQMYRRLKEGLPSPMNDRRVKALERIGFEWSGWADRKADQGPTTEDWSKLFEGMKEKGAAPGVLAKEHWFEGQKQFEESIGRNFDEDDLMALWNQEDDDDN